VAVSSLRDRTRRLTHPTLLRIMLLVVASALALAMLAFPIAIRPSSYPLQVGDVAVQDIQAPYSLNYASDVLTEQSRKDAEKTVPRIYLPSDPGITRRQIERLRVTLDYITIVRLDSYATPQQKWLDLAALSDVKINEEMSKRILALSGPRWDALQVEALNVLEQIMRNTIRDDQLGDAQRNIPTLISFSLSQEQAAIVADLVTPFVTANSLYSEEQTQAARQQARQAVQPMMRSFIAGETIVRRGQVITPTILEALQKFGLIKSQNNAEGLIAAAALVVLQSTFIALYFVRRHIAPLNDFKSLAMIAIMFLLFLYGARLIIPNRAVVPYFYPLPAFGLTIAGLFSLEISLVLSLVLSIMAAQGLPNALDLTLFYVLSSLCGILVMGKGRRISNFLWAGVAIGGAGSVVILSYRLPDTITDWIGLITLMGTAFLNGIASASLTLLLQYLLSQVLGLTTALQLLEIARPDNPLLQFILRNSPGTYQHSLQVANLAEQAAEAIGADALLIRVGAIYHDAGKAMNPSFFIENQMPGKINSHDDLDPAASAAIIIRHVSDGVTLARKYRLPPRIQDFMREHHGTLMTRYQYAQAVRKAGQPELVNAELFRYPGPRPRSRETALLMLADGCEARVRAESPQDEEALRILIKKVFDFCQREGQLDDTTLTLRDLNRAAESFVTALKNVYHPRIQYPELKPAAQPVAEGEPIPASGTTTSGEMP